VPAAYPIETSCILRPCGVVCGVILIICGLMKKVKQNV
jgi:hypothetical protein